MLAKVTFYSLSMVLRQCWFVHSYIVGYVAVYIGFQLGYCTVCIFVITAFPFQPTPFPRCVFAGVQAGVYWLPSCEVLFVVAFWSFVTVNIFFLGCLRWPCCTIISCHGCPAPPSQGQTMFRLVPLPGLGCVDVPSASMSLFNTLSIVVLLPLYDLAFLPMLKACCNYQPTQLQRTGVGTWRLVPCCWRAT